MTEDHERNREVTILVVEDDDALLHALRDILEDANYRVLCARNGKEAFEIFQSDRPNLILSDTSMPEMDGNQLLNLVRKTSEGKVIPFIFLTARGMRDDIFTGKMLGADDYLVKPITSQELLIIVQARLQRFEELRTYFDADTYHQK